MAMGPWYAREKRLQHRREGGVILQHRPLQYNHNHNAVIDSDAADVADAVDVNDKNKHHTNHNFKHAEDIYDCHDGSIFNKDDNQNHDERYGHVDRHAT